MILSTNGGSYRLGSDRHKLDQLSTTPIRQSNPLMDTAVFGRTVIALDKAKSDKLRLNQIHISGDNSACWFIPFLM